MRITGGDYKNRRLQVPEGRAVRPTSDRMRQTLFNLLHHAKWLDDFDLEGATVLDLYCGSGALGLEALSHGAQHCVFVDTDTASVKRNTSFLSEDAYRIVPATLPKLPEIAELYDLVFMDPPYFKGLIEPTVIELINSNRLKNNAILVIEAEKGLRLSLPLTHLDTRSQSQSDLHIFRYVSAI